MPTGSVVATCGATTLAGTLTYKTTYIAFALPTTANTANIAATG